MQSMSFSLQILFPCTCLSPVNIGDQWVLMLELGRQSRDLTGLSSHLYTTPRQAKSLILASHTDIVKCMHGSHHVQSNLGRVASCGRAWGERGSDLLLECCTHSSCSHAPAWEKYNTCQSQGRGETNFSHVSAFNSARKQRGFLRAGFTVCGKTGHRWLVILYCTR